MAVSIKLNEAGGAPETGERQVPGVTVDKEYPVHGFGGGGVVIVNDDGKFLIVSFSDIDAGWTVSVEEEEDDKWHDDDDADEASDEKPKKAG
jgi:hypothetical protein